MSCVQPEPRLVWSPNSFSLVLGIVSARPSAAQTLGSVNEPGAIHQAPCNFGTLQGDDAFYDTAHPSNTSCHTVVVSNCPYQGSATQMLPPVGAFVAVTVQPAGTTPLGTIILFSGAGGTSFFNFPYGGSNGLQGESYVKDYYNNPGHYTTVQVAWASPWEDNSLDPPIKSVKDEGCRPATLLKYIYDNYAQPATGAMCARA